MALLIFPASGAAGAGLSAAKTVVFEKAKTHAKAAALAVANHVTFLVIVFLVC
jgi:hypothetical protein